MISVFGPGSASDTICRIIADPLSKALGQPVVVEDRPGADGAVAALYVHHQPADGYTLLMATNSPLSADPFLHKSQLRRGEGFAPITRVGSFTLMLVINPKLPIHSVKELVAYAKANPGKLSFASGNTAGIVGGDTLAKWAGINMLHVPYKIYAAGARRHHRRPRLDDVRRLHHGDAACRGRHAARAGGNADQALVAVPGSADHGRSPASKGFNLDAWAGLVAPAGMPPDVVAKLNAALRKIIDSPDVQAKFKNVGFEGFSSTPGGARRLHQGPARRMAARWSRTPISRRIDLSLLARARASGEGGPPQRGGRGVGAAGLFCCRRTEASELRRGPLHRSIASVPLPRLRGERMQHDPGLASACARE